MGRNMMLLPQVFDARTCCCWEEAGQEMNRRFLSKQTCTSSKYSLLMPHVICTETPNRFSMARTMPTEDTGRVPGVMPDFANAFKIGILGNRFNV